MTSENIDLIGPAHTGMNSEQPPAQTWYCVLYNLKSHSKSAIITTAHQRSHSASAIKTCEVFGHFKGRTDNRCTELTCDIAYSYLLRFSPQTSVGHDPISTRSELRAASRAHLVFCPTSCAIETFRFESPTDCHSLIMIKVSLAVIITTAHQVTQRIHN